ncbi:MAG: SsrA-binding protein SmpB [Anaerolineales bacterium]|jgi:SsrA-binding protein
MKDTGIKVVATNRKARHDYFLEDEVEAGIELKGTEIKSVRAGQVSLKEAYVQTDGQQAWLIGAHIAPYEAASHFNHDPIRARRLLLHKRQITRLYDKVRQGGLTIIPIRMYLRSGIAKIEIALAKGKKKYDKRQKIAERDAERRIARELGRRR